MKRILLLIISTFLFLNLIACSKSTTTKSTNTNTIKDSTTKRVVTTLDDVEPNSEFKELTKRFMLELVGDYSSINQLFKDPSCIGYVRSEDEKASYPVYEDYKADQKEEYEILSGYLEELKKFDRDSLSFNQRLEFDVIEDICNVEILACNPDSTWFILTYDYINQYGGIVADVASDIENYDINDELDIVDIIDYLDSTTDSFKSMDKYLRDRVDNGFEFSDYTLDSMIEYMEGIVEHKDDYYLKAVLESKIDRFDLIDSSMKEKCKKDVKDSINNSFIKAVEDFIPTIRKYKGHWVDTEEGYVSHYGSKAEGYIEYRIKKVIGDYGEYISLMFEYMDAYLGSFDLYENISDLISAKGYLYRSEISKILGDEEKFLGCESVDELIDFLLENSKEVVYSLKGNPTIKSKFADETVQEFASYSAYYVLSAFDEVNSKTESITVNPRSFKSMSDYIFTLAHEGYPGHLYAHAYQKENGVPMLVFGLSRNGVSEAWAQYAAYKTLLTTAEKINSDKESDALRFIANETLANYVFSGFLDYLVNVLGYTVNDFMEEGFVSSKKEAIELIHYCDENVGNLTGYGLLFYKMVIDHKNVMNRVDSYDELEYNSFIMLNGGLYNLSLYERAINAYIELYK